MDYQRLHSLLHKKGLLNSTDVVYKTNTEILYVERVNDTTRNILVGRVTKFDGSYCDWSSSLLKATLKLLKEAEYGYVYTIAVDSNYEAMCRFLSKFDFILLKQVNKIQYYYNIRVSTDV